MSWFAGSWEAVKSSSAKGRGGREMSGKFIQITASGEYLYALDEGGEVWWLDERDKWLWKDIPDDRVRPEPRRRPERRRGR